MLELLQAKEDDIPQLRYFQQTAFKIKIQRALSESSKNRNSDDGTLVPRKNYLFCTARSPCSIKDQYVKYQDEGSPYLESEERLTEKFYRASTVFYWIVVNQEKVGFLRVVTSPEEKSIWLSPLLILPEFQKKGYASQAMRRIEEYYPTFIRWTLATIFQEKHLVRFYESLGYQIFKRENEQLGMDIVYMEKKK